jgi:hypothetical protein
MEEEENDLDDEEIAGQSHADTEALEIPVGEGHGEEEREGLPTDSLHP